MWVYHTKCIKRVGGFPNKVMVLVARYIKIRLMSHILEDTLTETKKIINIIVPLLTKTLNTLNSTQLFDFRSRNYHFPLYSLNFPGKQQHKNSLFAGLFQFHQISV